MKVIFFGTSQLATNILAFLLKNQINIVAIVTKSDKPRGQGKKTGYPNVKEYVLSQNLNIPLLQPEKASTNEFAEILAAYKPDLFVVVSYGEIIKEKLLKLPTFGCINVHPSLLPKYRGASPIRQTLLEGDRMAGVTIIEMSLQMDAGDVLAVESVPITDELNYLDLETLLSEVGGKLLMKVIHAYDQGKVIKIPQDHSKATYVKKIDPSMGKIDWNQSSQRIHNLIRAFSPSPGAWCLVKIGDQIKRLKIFKTHIEKNLIGTPGQNLFFDGARWIVACGSGALQILEIQLEGKKRMDANEFVKGIKNINFL